MPESLVTGYILVVENQQYLREGTVQNLHRADYQAIGVETGAQALLQARSCKPDLMILELMLPDMSGMDVCRQVKQDQELQSMGIILTSRRNEEDAIIDGLNLGADDYIPKPFSSRVLLARVRAVINRSATRARQAITS
ncbi:MAG: response regulator [Gammaproteobacteria bacterium]|nr:response regulator [Gammaproteobacteria bacterium]